MGSDITAGLHGGFLGSSGIGRRAAGVVGASGTMRRRLQGPGRAPRPDARPGGVPRARWAAADRRAGRPRLFSPPAAPRITARSACASIASVTWRCQPIQARTWYWSSPASPLAASKQASIVQRVPAMRTSSPSGVASGDGVRQVRARKSCTPVGRAVVGGFGHGLAKNFSYLESLKPPSRRTPQWTCAPLAIRARPSPDAGRGTARLKPAGPVEPVAKRLFRAHHPITVAGIRPALWRPAPSL